MAEIKLYDYDLVDDWGGVAFFCIGQGNLSAGVVVPIIEAVPDDEEILVKINSVGGFVFDGWAIYNALKAHKAKVTVRIDGVAASIASIIAMAGDEVIISQAAILMIHKPTVDGFWMGSMDADALKKEANALDQIQAVLNSIYVSKTGLDAATIDIMINAETWITPDLAKALGFANSILGAISDEAIESSMSENVFKQVFKNADAKTMAYANKIIKINKTMNTNVQEVLEKSEAALKENTSVMNSIKMFFKDLVKPKNEVEEPTNASSDLEDGGKIYYDGFLGVGTEVFTDEEMTTHPTEGDHNLADGNKITVDENGLVTVFEKSEDTPDADNSDDDLKNQIEELKKENAALLEANNKVMLSLNASNEALKKIKNVKSNFVPQEREVVIDRKNESTENKFVKPVKKK